MVEEEKEEKEEEEEEEKWDACVVDVVSRTQRMTESLRWSDGFDEWVRVICKKINVHTYNLV